MDLRGKDLRGRALDKLMEAGEDLRGSDFRGADLRRADLLHVDLRGCDLRGADLREAVHIALSELVGCQGGEWIPLAAWDRDTRFPQEFEEKLWTLGLRYRGHSQRRGTKTTAMERGLRAAARHPIDKTTGDWQEVIPYSACDG